MIKRYILHIELHRRYRPRISFKRAPRPGDRVVDGGVSGTLKRCPTCEEGFLHEPDPRKTKSKVLPDGPHKWLGGYCVDCENNSLWCPYPPLKPPVLGLIVAELAKSIQLGRSHRVRPARSDHMPRRAMDFNGPRHVELKHTEEKPAEHVELELIEEKPTQHVELKLTKNEDESPETLELGYELGTHKYEIGEIVWTHKAEYVVDKQTKKVLYLVRRDVWDARKKAEKAKHVELKLGEPSEHVELKAEDEKPTEIVQLKFK